MQKLRCTRGSPAHLSVAHEGPGPQALWHLFRRWLPPSQSVAGWIHEGVKEWGTERQLLAHRQGSPGASGDKDWAVGSTVGPGELEAAKSLERQKSTAEQLCSRQAGSRHLRRGCCGGGPHRGEPCEKQLPHGHRAPHL